MSQSKRERGAKGARPEISMIKLAVARAGFDIADRAVQVFGAAGLTNDTPVADFFGQMRKMRIYDGPYEVHARATSGRSERNCRSSARRGISTLQPGNRQQAARLRRCRRARR